MRTKQVPVYVDGEIVCYETAPHNARVLYSRAGTPFWYVPNDPEPLPALVYSAILRSVDSGLPRLLLERASELLRKCAHTVVDRNWRSILD